MFLLTGLFLNQGLETTEGASSVYVLTFDLRKLIHLEFQCIKIVGRKNVYTSYICNIVLM